MIVVTKEKRSKEITTNLDSGQVFANKPVIRELTWRVRTWRRPDGIRLGGGAVRLVWGNVADLVRSALFPVNRHYRPSLTTPAVSRVFLGFYLAYH